MPGPPSTRPGPGAGIHGPYGRAPAAPHPGAIDVPGGPPGGRLSRRRFLALGAGLAAAGALGATLGPRAFDELTGSPGAAAPAAPARHLVVLTLYGGNDGLNTVVPYQDPAYQAARGALAIAADTVLPLGQGFGLHPGLTGLARRWRDGHLAVVHGVGFADPNYSHFESMDIWQSGVPGEPVATGWLGRWLDTTGADPLRAVAVGPTVPPLMTGARVQAVALPIGPLVLPGGDQRHRFVELAATGAHRAPLDAQAVRSDSALLAADEAFGPLLRAQRAPAGTASSLAIADGGGGRSGGDVLATQLSLVANLIVGGAPARAYSVELGGFDTHSDQAPTQAALLAQLDQGLTSFLDAVEAHPGGRGTVVLVCTEFGRRLQANASAGTDHGWANVALVAGLPVKGGFYGEPPSLTALSDGNPVFTTDFRSLYATVLTGVLGVEATPILGARVPTLGFL